MAAKTVQAGSEGQKVKTPRRGIHNPVTYAFTVVILVIIVVAFIFVPAGAGMEGGSGSVVFGNYKGKPIEYIPGNYFSQQVDLANQRAEEEMRARNQTNDEDTLRESLYQIWREAFAITAFHTALVSIMQESGASVSETRIDEALVQYPRYMEDGEFSERRYNQVPSAERLIIRNSTREDLLYYSYIQDMIGIRASKAETEFLKSMSNPERNLRFVNFAFDEFPENMVADYGRENAEKFSQAKLSVITLTSSRSEAEKIREQALSGGADFAGLAIAQSRDTFAKTGGDMGWRYFYELSGFGRSDDDIRAIFSLAPGDISPVIEGPAGADGQLPTYSIFRCDETVRLPDFTRTETIAAARLYMNTYDRGRIEDYMLEQARAFKTKASESSFMSATLSSGKSVKETGFFPVNYGDSLFLKRVAQNNAELAAAAYRDNFFLTAFSLKADEVSEPLVLQDSVIVLQLLEEKQTDPEELSGLDFYLPNLLGRYQEESLQQFILNPNDFKDNFDAGFLKLYRFSD
ncbi:MAG: peptidyl-prolyl cis-trans isomerase [Spirochaetales bacterium]|jgi:parvulin-like peptidyl-prolyl isomerase|nr:peptidyl-prolyl cis-trans isomerase [Spirochaetales bacterium]